MGRRKEEEEESRRAGLKREGNEKFGGFGVVGMMACGYVT